MTLKNELEATELKPKTPLKTIGLLALYLLTGAFIIDLVSLIFTQKSIIANALFSKNSKKEIYVNAEADTYVASFKPENLSSTLPPNTDLIDLDNKSPLNSSPTDDSTDEEPLLSSQKKEDNKEEEQAISTSNSPRPLLPAYDQPPSAFNRFETSDDIELPSLPSYDNSPMDDDDEQVPEDAVEQLKQLRQQVEELQQQAKKLQKENSSLNEQVGTLKIKVSTEKENVRHARIQAVSRKRL